MKNEYSIFYHPNNVCMTYFEHLTFSLLLSKNFAIGSIKAFIHAIFPNLYITSSTDIVTKLKDNINNSGCKKQK